MTEDGVGDDEDVVHLDQARCMTNPKHADPVREAGQVVYKGPVQNWARNVLGPARFEDVRELEVVVARIGVVLVLDVLEVVPGVVIRGVGGKAGWSHGSR